MAVGRRDQENRAGYAWGVTKGAKTAGVRKVEELWLGWKGKRKRKSEGCERGLQDRAGERKRGKEIGWCLVLASAPWQTCNEEPTNQPSL